MGAWLARYATDPVDEAGDTPVGLAVDGKTVRGSRTDGVAVHLLAAALRACQTVIAQRQVTAESNGIPAFAPLLDRIDLGVVVTAGAMPTQRTHAEHVRLWAPLLPVQERGRGTAGAVSGGPLCRCSWRISGC
ncbi:hypothetical protein ACFYNZ_19730 [Streptomyces kebangsaanensis]|uniref:Transposase DDE domain-containing protein n=1 Tax=Streptomyces kebangsaanensis TaxID=864058 RepID=A0ABW6KWY0_9ACTN